MPASTLVRTTGDAPRFCLELDDFHAPKLVVVAKPVIVIVNENTGQTALPLFLLDRGPQQRGLHRIQDDAHFLPAVQDPHVDGAAQRHRLVGIDRLLGGDPRQRRNDPANRRHARGAAHQDDPGDGTAGDAVGADLGVAGGGAAATAAAAAFGTGSSGGLGLAGFFAKPALLLGDLPGLFAALLLGLFGGPKVDDLRRDLLRGKGGGRFGIGIGVGVVILVLVLVVIESFQFGQFLFPLEGRFGDARSGVSRQHGSGHDGDLADRTDEILEFLGAELFEFLPGELVKAVRRVALVVARRKVDSRSIVAAVAAAAPARNEDLPSLLQGQPAVLRGGKGQIHRAIVAEGDPDRFRGLEDDGQ
mmetsp:Transcript_7167/g.20810  ORF Transcript_7167/g.20810 Transcript_7167/m.20810 type:complete len:360 (-) Transcript_7167:1216-2295(-)